MELVHDFTVPVPADWDAVVAAAEAVLKVASEPMG